MQIQRYQLDLPNGSTKKPIVSDVEYLTTTTLKHNNNKYKLRIYCNNGNDTWGSQCKFSQKEWKEKQGKTNFVRFYDYVTNEVIYLSYFMAARKD